MCYIARRVADEPRVLLGVTGSIAAYKSADLTRRLIQFGLEVQVILTRGGSEFITAQTLEALSGRRVVRDWTQQGEIAHVEMGYRADLALVAPASAHTLARLAHGLADDPLTATLLSYDGPLWVAPAMESRMWRHPATQDNVRILRDRGIVMLGPETGALASGRSGAGRMMEPADIADAVRDHLVRPDLRGETLLITAGPTVEPIDPVRFLSNRSTGVMGVELARQAAMRGATVHLVLGPTSIPRPVHDRILIHSVETALEMKKAVDERAEGATIFISAAAVSDFRPAAVESRKLKKDRAEAYTLNLVLNPDILSDVANTRRTDLIILGFAAETEDVEKNARKKLHQKGAHVIIANRVGPGRGFGQCDTELLWVDAASSIGSGSVTKPRAARFILDRLVALVRRLRA
ncbi:MAG: bifunctional phosphopantothenoylcysteine decarboxylase/phosphopantothenate--cysteine ligase CoaBC [Myxococcota bacterium]